MLRQLHDSTTDIIKIFWCLDCPSLFLRMPDVTELVMATIYAQLRATMDRAIQTAALVPLKMGVFAILFGKEIASPSTPWRASTPRMRAPGDGTVIALQTWEVLLAMHLVSVIRKHS